MSSPWFLSTISFIVGCMWGIDYFRRIYDSYLNKWRIYRIATIQETLIHTRKICMAANISFEQASFQNTLNNRMFWRIYLRCYIFYWTFDTIHLCHWPNLVFIILLFHLIQIWWYNLNWWGKYLLFFTTEFFLRSIHIINKLDKGM